jgi:hypothetical protein
MTSFEYKVMPAPMRGLKAKGVKGTPARFANALETVMNDLGAEGWEYQRTDTLPVQERQGLTGKTTSFQNMLVFRRAIVSDVADLTPVAALIEDQSAQPIVEDAVPIADTSDDDVAQDAPASDDSATAARGDTQPLVAEDRVSQTLNEPFVFPWNKRATNSAASDPDTKDTTAPTP